MTTAALVLTLLAAGIVATVTYAVLHRRQMRRALSELLQARKERETRERLERDNDRLERDVDGLRGELAALKQELLRRETVASAHAGIAAHVPRDAVVVVVSRGDDELITLDGRTGWHFPQGPDGVYAGHHPATSDEAVAQLDALRQRGAGYLVFPATAAWWLEHYEGFREHLERCHRRVTAAHEGCTIYALEQHVRQPVRQRLRTVNRG